MDYDENGPGSAGADVLSTAEPLRRVIAEVEAQRHGDFLHDELHATKVGLIGLQLADLLERHTTTKLTHQERFAVLLFGLLHDSQQGDHWEAGHAQRAVAYARALDLGTRLRLGKRVLDRLYFALEGHESGELTDDAIAACCWDADRLQLWRQGINPDPERLSTSPARSEWVMRWAFEVSKISCDVSWDDLLVSWPRLSPASMPKRGPSTDRRRKIRLYRAPPLGYAPSELGACWTPSIDYACAVLAQYEYRAKVIWSAEIEYRPSRILDLIPNFEYCLAQALHKSTADVRTWCAENAPVKVPGEVEYSAAAILRAREFAEMGFDWVPFRDGVIGPFDDDTWHRRFQILAWIKTNDDPITPEVWARVDDVRVDCCPVHIGYPLQSPRGYRWCERGQHHVEKNPTWPTFGTGKFTPEALTIPSVRERVLAEVKR